MSRTARHPSLQSSSFFLRATFHVVAKNAARVRGVNKAEEGKKKKHNAIDRLCKPALNTEKFAASTFSSFPFFPSSFPRYSRQLGGWGIDREQKRLARPREETGGPVIWGSDKIDRWGITGQIVLVPSLVPPTCGHGRLGVKYGTAEPSCDGMIGACRVKLEIMAWKEYRGYHSLEQTVSQLVAYGIFQL